MLAVQSNLLRKVYMRDIYYNILDKVFSIVHKKDVKETFLKSLI
jgi:hypothetical protein